MGRTTTTQLKGHFVDENWSCIHTIYQSSTGLLLRLLSQQGWLMPGLNWPWARGKTYEYLMTQLPLFITSTSLSLQRTSLLMNNDVTALKTSFGFTTDGTFECTVNNRDWMKVIHFNHTTERPPSHYPRGLLYLSTFSFLLLFLVLADGKAIALWDVCPWRIRQQKEIFIPTVDVEWE